MGLLQRGICTNRSRLIVRAVTVAIALFTALSVAAQSFAAPISIDNFSLPSTPRVYVINQSDANPLLISTTGTGILGGQRDLTVTVVSGLNPVAATGVIGGGGYNFGSSAAKVSAKLVYAGVGGGGFSATDLTQGGLLTTLALDFNSFDGGPNSTLTNVKLDMDSTGGGSATFTGLIPDSASPFRYNIPLALLVPSGPFSLTSVTDLKLTINGTTIAGPSALDVDFDLRSVSVVPEPSSALLLSCGGLACMALWIRKRKAVARDTAAA